MKPLRFALIGAGFWARYQLAGWYEHEGVSCVAICDHDKKKAETLAKAFNIPASYDSLNALLTTETPDFIDIVTSPPTHKLVAERCAAHGLPVVCQKPMAETLAEAEAMVETFAKANLPLLINENWRWQRPIREAGKLLHFGAIGKPFRGRITFSCSFPVFDNQPFLAEIDQFILTDIGSHILDVARYLFGEAQSVTCLTRRINPKIKGEDVATVLMPMAFALDDEPVAVTCEMSYASRTEQERFPQTYLYIEGDEGTLELSPDFSLRLTDRKRGSWQEPSTDVRRVPPPRYTWADPAYDLIHASIVACHGDLLKHLRGEGIAETSAANNLETVRLIFAAYESARIGKTVAVNNPIT